MKRARRLQELADRIASIQRDIDTVAGHLTFDEMDACADALEDISECLSEPERRTRTIAAMMDRAEALEFFGGRW